MRVQPLQTYDLPDVGDHLIHFTGRSGARTDDVDQRILNLSPERRLVEILVDRVIRGFEALGAGAPVACFSESTKASIPKLIRDGRYAPYGIAFSKQLIFENGGGPALYVRGDEWETMAAAVPQPVRSRLVRFGQERCRLMGRSCRIPWRTGPSGFTSANGVFRTSSASTGGT
jgi:hypothetical protein